MDWKPLQSELKWIKAFLGVIVLFLIMFILKELKVVFIPLTLAFFLTFLFAPMHRMMEKKRIPLAISLLVTIIVIIAIFNAAGMIIYYSVASITDEEMIARYETRLIELIYASADYLDFPIDQVMMEFEEDGLYSLIQRIPLTRIMIETLGGIGSFLLTATLTIVFMLFIVAGKNRLIRRLSRTLTTEEAMHSSHIFTQIEHQISRYLLVKTIISVGTAVFGMFFMYLFNIDFIFVTGILLFILNYIPNVGSILASIFPVMVSILEYGLGWQTFAITGALLLTHTTYGQVIEPRFMGSSLNLSPVVILFSLIAWAYIWGSVGMALAIPIMFTANIIAREFRSTRLIAALMSDD